MKNNEKILTILEKNFEKNFENVQEYTFENFINFLITENPDAYYIGENRVGKLFDEETINKFNLALSNKKVIKAFDKLVTFSYNENFIIEEFKKDLTKSFDEIKNGLKFHKDSKIQIILFTYDFEPYAWISGFGEGKYPILERPEYFDFNYQMDFFEILGNINYENIWKEQREFENILEELDIFDDILDTELFQNIKNCTLYKTYMLINKSLKYIENELFKGLDIKKPLFIYGNEHGCEYTNIYCYE